MAKKYKVKMTESQLENFKAYLEEQKKESTKKVIKEATEDVIDDDFEDDEEEDEDDGDLTTEEMHDKLVEMGIATEEEVQLVTSINGYNDEAMLDILYARTGYRNFDQMENE